jgi:hypothetical protein
MARRSKPVRGGSDARSVARGIAVREGWHMFAERAESTPVRAEDELAVRRAAFDRATAAAEADGHDADVIDLIDCALALHAAEALAGANRASSG